LQAWNFAGNMQGGIYNEEEVATLLGEGLALEFTRDSPFARQHFPVFEDDGLALAAYCSSVHSAISNVEQTLRAQAAAQEELRLALLGNPPSRRALFSKSVPSLAPLSETIHKVASLLEELSCAQLSLQEGLSKNVKPFLEALKDESAVLVSRARRTEMEAKRATYEKLLCSALQQGGTLSEDTHSKILQARVEAELRRYDIVLNVNRLDTLKVCTLTRAMLALHQEVSLAHEAASSALTVSAAALQSSQGQLETAERSMEVKDELWQGMATRLKHELLCQLPPPNSPLLAACPVQPRAHRHNDYYSLSFALTTEILSGGTRNARFEERRHALTRDGVYRQGWLLQRMGFFSGGATRRQWFRLHQNLLNVVTSSSSGGGGSSSNNNNNKSSSGGGSFSTTDTQVVCDVSGAVVSHVGEGALFGFRLTLAGGRRSFDFQAENEEELVKWVQALRRCAGAGGEVPASGPSGRLAEWLGQEENSRCADCSSAHVSWASVNVGISLCEECALVHQQLGWTVSKLKHLSCDHFPDWQVDLLLLLGNARANEIWEAQVPVGWAKITTTSSLEKRSSWIRAKYLWFAFVSDDRVSEEQLWRDFANGDASVSAVHAYLARQSVDINAPRSPVPGSVPCTLLRLALARNDTTVARFLLLNGAEFDAADEAAALLARTLVL